MRYFYKKIILLCITRKRMLKNFFIIFIITICIFSFFSNAMDPVTTPKIYGPHDIIFLKTNMLAIASDNGCHLVLNFQLDNPTIHLLDDQPTHKLITNQNKQKIGLYSKNCFLIYDVLTKQKIWSHDISIQQIYSAAFNPVADTFFLYHNGKLISNTYNTISLPDVKPNTLFKIVSHPHKAQITYKTINSTLSTLSLSDGTITCKSSKINNHSIVGMRHSPYSQHTIVITSQKKIFIYNLDHANNHEVNLDKCMGKFSCITFLPDSSIVAIPCNNKAIHFWNYITKKIITIAEFANSISRKKYSRTCSFSPHNTKFIVFTKRYCISHKTPLIIRNILHVNKHCPFPYWILQQYSKSKNNLLSKDILNLFAQALVAVYTKGEKSDQTILHH